MISFLAREGTLRVPTGVLIYEVSSGVVLVIAAFPIGPATTQAGPRCVHSVVQGGFV